MRHTVVVIPEDLIPKPPPESALFVKSIRQAESDSLISRGMAYVAYKKYDGFTKTGTSPWVVTINQGDNQVIVSRCSDLTMAIQLASEKNADDSVTANNPKSHLLKVIPRIFKQSK